MMTPFITSLLLLHLAVSGRSATFEIVNQCTYTIWPATMPSGSGRLDPGSSWVTTMDPGQTIGRIWARTGCSFDSSGRGRCESGDCNGTLNCQSYGTSPATLVEFSTNQVNNLDFFDISLVDGFNVPVEFSPVSANGTGSAGCSAIRCAADVTALCPAELRATGGCNSPCAVFRTDEYCCTNRGGACGPTNYSSFFKRNCPDAYSYPLDDATSTFTCPGGTSYRVVFCPSDTDPTAGELRTRFGLVQLTSLKDYYWSVCTIGVTACVLAFVR